MSGYLNLRDIDWGMLVIVLVICALGVVQIFSAAHDTAWGDAWWKQIIWIGAGLLLMWIATSIDYHALMTHITPLYLLSVGLLVMVLAVGRQAWGATRWVPLVPGFHFQVSEFVKLVIILLVARFMTELRGDTIEFRDLLKILALIVVPMLLVIREPDLGTALTYLPILAVGAFLAGLNWRYLVAVGIIVVLVLPVGYHFLQPYQKARLVSFLDPDRDPRGTGYQVIQSKIAVGAGGMWGKGVAQGTQTQLRFLPVPHTDFIFAAFAEEHGFAGVVVVLALYFMLLMQIVKNAQTAPDRAGMYICMGVAALLLFHVLVNVGMVAGRMPVTGIPLPLMSAGGSSMLSMFLMLGLVNNVRVRRFVN
jgi:rod shape determining protein RodA